jgi:hypothetical protein
MRKVTYKHAFTRFVPGKHRQIDVTVNRGRRDRFFEILDLSVVIDLLGRIRSLRLIGYNACLVCKRSASCGRFCQAKGLTSSRLEWRRVALANMRFNVWPSTYRVNVNRDRAS